MPGLDTQPRQRGHVGSVWKESSQFKGETGFRNGVIGFWMAERSQRNYC